MRSAARRKAFRRKLSILVATVFFSAAGCGMLAAQAAPAPQAKEHSELPPGPGRDATVATCSKCHSISNVSDAHKDRDGWTGTITKMIGYGASASDDDFKLILEYVVTNFGPDAVSGSKK